MSIKKVVKKSQVKKKQLKSKKQLLSDWLLDWFSIFNTQLQKFMRK